MLNYEFPPLGGGAGNATYYLLKEFAKKDDIKIDLITSSVEGYQENNFSENIRIFFLDIGKGGNLHYQSNWDLIKYSRKAYRKAKELKKYNSYDLVHAFFGIPCGYLAMKLGLPYVVSLRGSDVPFYNERFYWLDKLIFKKLSKKIWVKAAVVTVNSCGLKELALKSSPTQPIEVIYNGIDTDEFRPLASAVGNFTVISTSRLIKRKGMEYLLDAFIKFRKKCPNSKLLIAGKGNLEAMLKEKALNSGYGDNIEFLGAVIHKKMPEVYRQADIFILPSLNEGMSNSLLEAMASGLAVVATDTGGTKELVDSSNGIIIKKSDTKSIYDALKKLYQSKNLLESMKKSSREKAQKMSWEEMAKRYSIIYEKTCAE